MPSFKIIRLMVLENIFEGLKKLQCIGGEAILVMLPGPFTISSPLPMEVSHEIWLSLAKRFGRRSLKMVDDVRTSEHSYTISWLYGHFLY